MTVVRGHWPEWFELTKWLYSNSDSQVKSSEFSAQTNRNWTVEDWERFYGQNLTSTTWIHGPNLPCVNGADRWFCNGVGNGESLVQLGSILPVSHCLNLTAYVRVAADNVDLTKATIYPVWEIHYVTKQTSSQTIWKLRHANWTSPVAMDDSSQTSSQTAFITLTVSSDLNPIGCGRMEAFQYDVPIKCSVNTYGSSMFIEMQRTTVIMFQWKQERTSVDFSQPSIKTVCG